MYKIIKNVKNQKQRRLKMTQNGIKILKTMLLAVMIIFCICKTHAIEKSNIRPTMLQGWKTNSDGTKEWVVTPVYSHHGFLRITQPDGTDIELLTTTYPSGYVHYSFVPHDRPSYTAILDTLTGYWCYAKLGDDGWLETTGFPIHKHDGRDLRLDRFIIPTQEKIDNFNLKEIIDEPQTRDFTAPWIKMGSTGFTTSLVIYVKPSDIPYHLFVIQHKYTDGVIS